MVWIKPKPGGGSGLQDERQEWRTLIRNPYFKLQQRRDDQPVPGFVSKKKNHSTTDVKKASTPSRTTTTTRHKNDSPNRSLGMIERRGKSSQTTNPRESKALSRLHKAKSPPDSPKTSFRILLLRQAQPKAQGEGEAAPTYYIISEERRERKVQQEWEFIKTNILPKVS